MAYYMVKSGGTATGDGGRLTSAPTGAWSGTASEYYDNFEDCNVQAELGVGMVAGDEILASHLHEHDYAAQQIIKFRGNIKIKSVDNSNREDLLAGAYEHNLGGVSTDHIDIEFLDTSYKTIAFYGVKLEAYDQLRFDDQYHKFLFVDGSVLKAGSRITLLGNASILEVKDSEMSPGANIYLQTAVTLRMDNVTSTSTNLVSLFYIHYGAAVVDIKNTDLSGILNSSYYLLIPSTSASATININRCKIDDGLVSSNPTSSTADMDVYINDCDSGSDIHDFRYFIGNKGTVTKDTTNYLSAYDGNTYFSYLVNSTSVVSSINPVKFRIMLDSNCNFTISKIVKINFTSNTELTNEDIYFSLDRVMSSTTSQGLAQTNQMDEDGTSTSYTTNTEAWKQTKTYRYEYEFTMPVISSVNIGSFDLFCYVVTPSIDVWICPNVVITDA